MVGDILRREREKQGLTIKDVEAETSIRAIYIDAIEKGEYESLPGDVYTKGFIRNYSKMLGLDGDNLLQQFNSERNISKPVQPVDMVQKAEQEIFSKPEVKKPVIKPVSRQSSDGGKLFSSGDDYRERVEEKSGSKKFMILLAIMLLFLGGVYIAFSDDGTSNTKPQVKTEQTAKNTPVKNDEKKYDGIEVVAKFSGDCWVAVQADGKQIFEGTVEKGKEFTWKAKDKLSITAGNAGAVELTYNGKDIGKMGEAGHVEERIMTKDNDGSKLEVVKNEPEQQQEAQPADAKPATSKKRVPGGNRAAQDAAQDKAAEQNTNNGNGSSEKNDAAN